MGDVSDKGSECEGGSISSSDGCNMIKICVDCGTSNTPLWRGGPAGPKSLCNACGIRSRKRRRALLGIKPKDDKKPKKTVITTTSSYTSGGDSQTSDLTTNKNSQMVGNFCLKKRILAFGSEVVLQRPRSRVTKKRSKKYGEEEQAAYLLMALSCGSVIA